MARISKSKRALPGVSLPKALDLSFNNPLNKRGVSPDRNLNTLDVGLKPKDMTFKQLRDSYFEDF